MHPSRSVIALCLPILTLAACASAPPQATVMSKDRSAKQAQVGESSSPQSRLPYPDTKRQDLKETIHGIEVFDPYRWLEDEKSQEVQAWVDKQDAFARAYLAKLPHRAEITERLKELYYYERVSAPTRRGQRLFYTRREAQAEKSRVYWKPRRGGEEHVLLDPSTWSSDGSLALGSWVPNWDGSRVAYLVKKNNSDDATLYVIDVATGKRSDIDVIEGGRYAVPQWTPEGDGFYYIHLPNPPDVPTSDRPGLSEARYHKLGQDPKLDRLIHPKTGDSSAFLNIRLSMDGNWLVATIAHGWNRSEVFYRPARQKDAPWTPLATGIDAIFWLDVWKNRFYVHTNYRAPRWRVIAIDPSRPGEGDWKEIVPERTDATLDQVSIVGNHLSLSYLKDAASEVELRGLGGNFVRKAVLPGIAKSDALWGRPDDDEAYITYESFAQAPSIDRISVRTGLPSPWFQPKVSLDSSRFVTKQRFAISKDGTRIPVFIVHMKTVTANGSAPGLLTGYGGFNVSEVPDYAPRIIPWLEQGGVFADANLRGGNEYGEMWHRAGMRENKQNVFDDFVAVAEYLINEGYVAKGRLAIQGGSNGGLLMGGALTQRPDLFKAVACGVPLLDMLRYHLVGAGKTWIEEYGSPTDPKAFQSLLAYSPYHHVKDGTSYPSVLMLAADSDDRVDPMHARKFAAALQHASSNGPVLLRVQRHAGHGGADLVRERVEQDADLLSFVLDQTAPAAPVRR